MAKDKDGRVYFFSQSGATRLSHYTKLDVPDSPQVRLLHNGQLTHKQKEQMRDNIFRAREDVNEAIKNLSKRVDQMGPETRRIIADQLGVHPGHLTDEGVAKINNHLKQTANGLYSPKIEIKLVNRMYTGEVGRNRLQRAPHRELPEKTRSGMYTDTLPDINLKMTKSYACDTNTGPQHIIRAVAQAAAKMDDRNGAALARFTHELKTAVINDEQIKNLGIEQATAHQPGVNRSESPSPYSNDVHMNVPASSPHENQSETTNAIFAHIHHAAEPEDVAATVIQTVNPAEPSLTVPESQNTSDKMQSIARDLKTLANNASGILGALEHAASRMNAYGATALPDDLSEADAPDLNSLPPPGEQLRPALEKMENLFYEINTLQATAESTAKQIETRTTQTRTNPQATIATPRATAEERATDMDLVNGQMGKLSTSAGEYSREDREEIAKALLGGLNDASRKEVLRNLQPRMRNPASR